MSKKKNEGKLLSLPVFIVMGIAILIAVAIGIKGFATSSKENSVDRKQEILELEKQKEEANLAIIDLEEKMSKEFFQNGFSSKYYSYQAEMSKKEDEVSDLSTKIFDLKNKSDSSISSIVFVPFMMIPLFAGIFISSILMMINYFRTAKFESPTIEKDLIEKMKEAEIDKDPVYKEYKCPNCGAALSPEKEQYKKCEYCGARLYRTKR